jgi:hypothetical protein
MIETLPLMVLGVLGLLVAWSALSRRHPGVRGLQPFQQTVAPINAAQSDVARRRWDLLAGVKFILIGLALPILYVMSRVMQSNDLTWRGIVIAGGGSLLCFVLGARAIRNGLH